MNADCPAHRFASLFLAALSLIRSAHAQTYPASTQPAPVTSNEIDDFQAITAAATRDGLGFNINLKEWEFQLAASAGATEVRFQPGWSSVENMDGVLALPKADDAALNWCGKYHLMPMLVAAYGPPYKSLGKFTVAEATPAGSTSIKLNESVSNVTFPYCHIKGPRSLQIVPNGRWAYYGALITAADAASNTVTLAAATSIGLDAGQPLVINRLLYPSCTSADPNDPSIAAYGRYAKFLAEEIAAHGLHGKVELWNEPGWAHDAWDHRGQFYDHKPDDVTKDSPNFGIAKHLAPTTLPAGVRYCWGGTNKSGGRSVLNPSMMTPLTPEQVANSISSEALHPYGNNPEEHMWDPAILDSADVRREAQATLSGASWSSNMKHARWLSLQRPELNFKTDITETGTISRDNARKARFIVRQYLGFLGEGIERMDFFCLAAPNATSDETFGFVDETTQAPTQAYIAIKGLVATDMADLPIAPARFDKSNLPAAHDYSGTYPLMTVSVVGRHAETEQKNVIDFVAWQRSMQPPGASTNLAVTSTTSQVKLSWTPDVHAVSSTLLRSTVSGGPYTTVAANLRRKDYTDKSVASGLTYFYVLIGNNPAGDGTNSNEVSATPAAGAAGTFNNQSRPAGAEQESWLKLSSPPAATVSVHLPPNTTATRAWNLVTRAAVIVNVTGDEARYPIADDPICLQVVPKE